MFDFERFDVYQTAKVINREVFRFLREDRQIDLAMKNQLRRASLSVVLNIAEGTGRFTDADKKHFYTMARSSVFECVACLDIIQDEGFLSSSLYQNLYGRYEDISRILFKVIKDLRKSSSV
jgi:four helix bundle protein